MTNPVNDQALWDLSCWRAPIGSYWKHEKSGGIYRVTGYVMLEATSSVGVLYVAHREPPEPSPYFEWCRPLADFLDGRFTPQFSLRFRAHEAAR